MSSTSRNQRCRLCGSNEPLINSHIFSKFLLKQIHIEDPQYINISSLEGIKKGQGGLKEYLLCSDCEGMRSNWEGYARHFLLSENAPQMIHVEYKLYKIENIDYKKLKLFILSILWLLSVTESIKEKIDLGPHEETIRKMLLNEDPGEADNYGIFMQYVDVEHAKESLAYNSHFQKYGGYNAYFMFLGGFLWTIFIDSRRLRGTLKDVVLQKDGTAHLIKIKANEHGFFKGLGKLIPHGV